MVLPSDFTGLGGIILRTENSLYSNTIKQKHIYLGNGVSLSDFNKMFYSRVSAVIWQLYHSNTSNLREGLSAPPLKVFILSGDHVINSLSCACVLWL